MKKVYLILMLVITASISAAYSQDNGVITNVFVNATGGVAFKVNGGRNGIPNAVNEFACTTNGGWIGSQTMDSKLHSAILSAKMAGNSVTVTVIGCDGGWFKVSDIYIN